MSDLSPTANPDMGVTKKATRGYAMYVFWVMFSISFLNSISVVNGGTATPNPPFAVKNVIAHIEDKCTALGLSMLKMAAGQKFLLRLSPERAARLKAVLREIRGEVTGQIRR